MEREVRREHLLGVLELGEEAVDVGRVEALPEVADGLALQARGVAEQPTDGQRGVPGLGQPRPERVLQVETALVAQLHDQQRREGLGDRADHHLGVVVRRRRRVEPGQARRGSTTPARRPARRPRTGRGCASGAGRRRRRPRGWRRGVREGACRGGYRAGMRVPSAVPCPCSTASRAVGCRWTASQGSTASQATTRAAPRAGTRPAASEPRAGRRRPASDARPRQRTVTSAAADRRHRGDDRPGGGARRRRIPVPSRAADLAPGGPGHQGGLEAAAGHTATWRSASCVPRRVLGSGVPVLDDGPWPWPADSRPGTKNARTRTADPDDGREDHAQLDPAAQRRHRVGAGRGQGTPSGPRGW